ncbi:MAG: phage portal protein [Armatimonadetes bacterium]|nr:phage portal protein [Armatimonadota bacterium]
MISLDTIDATAPGERWPPTAADERRLADYERNLKLFLGRHQEVFDPYRRPDEGPYVTANILGAISRLAAHRLFGEAPKARAKGGSGSEVSGLGLRVPRPTEGLEPGTRDPRPQTAAAQRLLDFLCRSNGWQPLCHSGALGGSYRGDTVLRVRYDAGHDAVVIDDVPPSCFFPHLDPGAPEGFRAVSLAWVVEGSDEREVMSDEFGRRAGLRTPHSSFSTARPAFLREEYHEPGRIENRLWKLVAVPGQTRYYRRPVELSALEATAGLPEVVETGLDVVPIVHIPNRRVAETGLWGQSDYADLIPLQEALNRRRTQISSILDKHSDPLLAIDESFLDEQGRVPMDRIRAIPLVQDEPPPQYVTWDGKLADSRAEAEELLHTILLVAGISPESLGFGQGGFPESGLAIRLRQMLTTSTVVSKRLHWEPGLRRLLSLAMKMHVRHVSGLGSRVSGSTSSRQPETRDMRSETAVLEPDEIGIEFGDGLPPDLSASISDEVALQGAGLASKEASLHRLFPDWTEAEIDAEVERLAADVAPASGR